MDIVYTAEALATGEGRNGRTRTSDGRIDLQLARPRGMGGSGNGANPEQLFAAGYAACFHSALQRVAREAGTELRDSSVGAHVGIGPNGEGGFALEVALEVVIPGLEPETATALVERAHRVCPYSNATRGNIEVALTVAQD